MKNEELLERLELVTERIKEIVSSGADSVEVSYRECFLQMSKLILSLYETAIKTKKPIAFHDRIYDDLREENYKKSYADPRYAVSVLGKDYGQVLSVLDACLHSIFPHCAEGDLRYICYYAELFVEIYNCFEDEELLSPETVKGILYSFMHDYTEVFEEKAIETLIDPSHDYAKRIVMEADLFDTAYLYDYGLFVWDDELKLCDHLAGTCDEAIQEMADTFTEGYRIGFEVTGKDITKKSVVEIRYPVGFERVIKAAVNNFKIMGLDSVLKPFSVSINRQYKFDHLEDMALWLDKAYVERDLEVARLVWEKNKDKAKNYGGPAVTEVFGQEPFSPEQKDERVSFDKKQRELSVRLRSKKSSLINKYIHGDERSFTIIAYPTPSIGDRFEEIFSETVRINTLDYALYRDMQQRIIDVLDTAKQVHITGRGENKTDLYVEIYPLKDPSKETAFENCVADVNIPVGEVFTTPVLKGTNGRLHVTGVFLNGLLFKNLEIVFKDGMTESFSCTNFSDEDKNKRFIEDNLLFHHRSLPMGEFAIGTNTTAYMMAKKYNISDRLPILIAEKTGPHFAVGDTCYTYEEDNVTYNPDGKAIVARSNGITDYLNCHTDITIPYDELGRITAIGADGSETDIIVDGRFVVAGTEQLNKPFDDV